MVFVDRSFGNLHDVVETKFFGKYNISNILGVVAAMRASGIDLSICVKACKSLTAGTAPSCVESIEDEPTILRDLARALEAFSLIASFLKGCVGEEKKRSF